MLKATAVLIDRIDFPPLLSFLLATVQLNPDVFRVLLKKVCGDFVPAWFRQVPQPQLNLHPSACLIFDLPGKTPDQIRLAKCNTDNTWVVVYNVDRYTLSSADLSVEKACELALILLQERLG